jgi:hypothetical protein
MYLKYLCNKVFCRLFEKQQQHILQPTTYVVIILHFTFEMK